MRMLQCVEMCFLPALHCMAFFDGGKDGVGMKADLDVYKMSVLRFEIPGVVVRLRSVP